MGPEKEDLPAILKKIDDGLPDDKPAAAAAAPSDTAPVAPDAAEPKKDGG